MKLQKKIKYIIMLAVIASLALFSFLSPLPAIWFFKVSFNINFYSMPENYDSLKNNVIFTRNISYNSAYPEGKFDIIHPKTAEKNGKLIFWVHGGGFISGHKEMVEHYMVILANKGFDIVNIDYSVAPKSRYPVQLKQIEEAFMYIQEHASDYGLNLSKVYFGGDSAGAHLAAQFVNIQVDKEYASAVNNALKGKNISINNVINKNNIAGTVLFCGPYDLADFLNPERNTMILPFKKIGWAYFGTKDVNDKNIALCNIINHVSADFPPAFITDGNTLSFENQAKELEKAMKEKNIYVKSVFYSKEEASLKHEYQFHMDSKYAKSTLEEVLKFLDETGNTDLQK